MEYFRALFLDLYSKYQKNNCLLEEKMLVGNVSRESHGDAHAGLTLQPRFPGDGTVLGLKEGVRGREAGQGALHVGGQPRHREGLQGGCVFLHTCVPVFLEHSPPGLSLHRGSVQSRHKHHPDLRFLNRPLRLGRHLALLHSILHVSIVIGASEAFS